MKKSPIRVLHLVFDCFGPGGIETYLMNLVQQVDPSRVVMDAAVLGPPNPEWAEIWNRFGGRFIPLQTTLNQRSENIKEIRSVIRDGNYDIVVSTRYGRSWTWLREAKKQGVPVRLFHLHNIFNNRFDPVSLLEMFFRKRMLQHYSTHFAFCSDHVAKTMWGPKWLTERDRFPNSQTVYCGIDFDAFRSLPSKAEARKILGLNKDAFILGHAGRFDKTKNHVFIIDVFEKVLKQEPRARLLFLGRHDGKSFPAVKEKIERLNLSDKVILPGFRSDVASLLPAMDVFVFPSRFEGLGLAVLEAQAAGVPFVMADTIPQEAVVIDPLFLGAFSLATSPEIWADAVLKSRFLEFPSQKECYEKMLESRFELNRAAQKFMDYYESLVDEVQRRSKIGG